MQQTSYEVYVNDTHTSVACRDSHVKRWIHVMYKYTIFTAVLSAGGISKPTRFYHLLSTQMHSIQPVTWAYKTVTILFMA